MFFAIGWSVLVHFVHLYTKRALCAVPLRIVTMKSSGALTPSRPAIINIIPDQDPLIQRRRQQTPHPPPMRRNSYEDSYESSETEEFPNPYNYAGYYYDKDYYKYYRSYYQDDGDVGFQFKHPRYPYGHTLFAEALVMKQVPFVFKEVFFPSQAKGRLSSILVGDFYTQTVPFELFPAKMPRRRRLNRKTSKHTPIFNPQTQHQIRRRTFPNESPNSKNFKSILSYYAYNEDRKESKTKIQIADKKSNNKNSKSMLSYYAYHDDENEGTKYSSYKSKIPSSNKQTRPSKFRRLLEKIRNKPTSAWDVALQKLGPPPHGLPKNSLRSQVDSAKSKPFRIPADPQDGPPGFIPIYDSEAPVHLPRTTEFPVDARRQLEQQYKSIDSHEGGVITDAPFDLNMPDAAAMAIAPAISFFKDLFKG